MFSAPRNAHAQDSAALLDKILLDALGASANADAARVAAEIRDRDARKARGDELDIARTDEENARKQMAEMARDEEKRRRDEARAAREEADRLAELAEQAERDARREAAAARRAANERDASASANSIIMEAITRNAASIASAQIQGQAAVNSAYDQVAAINAQRRAEADARAAAVAQANARNREAADRARQQAEDARQKIEAARRQADAARARQATTLSGGNGTAGGGGSSASGTTIRAGVAPGGSNNGSNNGAGSIVAGSAAGGNAPDPVFGGGTASLPFAPRPAQSANAAGGASSSYSRPPVNRDEALAYCYHQKAQDPGYGAAAWYCDGPGQNTLTTATLARALELSGCRDADFEHRHVPFNKGQVFFCEKALASYDSDIGTRYGVSGDVQIRRNSYLCGDATSTCDRSNAVSVTPGRG